MTALIQAPKHQTPSSYTVERVNYVTNPVPGTSMAGLTPVRGTVTYVPATNSARFASDTQNLAGMAHRVTITPGTGATGSPMPAGGQVQISGEIQSAAARALAFQMYWFDAAGTALPNAISPNIIPTVDFVRYTQVFVAPPAAAFFVAHIGYMDAPGGNAFDLRKLYAGAPGPSFDGTTPAPRWDQVYAWKGAVNASTSQLRQNIYAVQIPRTTPDLVLGYRTSWATNNIVHDIIGSAEPAYTLRAPGPRSGTLNLFYATESAAWEAAALHRQLDVFEYTDTDRPRHSMRYVVADGDLEIELDDTTRNRWVLPVPYREVIS